ncbi:MAG: BPL-N domain-containing protein [Kiritimatiellae bacterium]|nr:BPL-N domain-containing protein [Kiritimatiellia bacterium]MDD5522398.1 BPL-N domain-containing protein [Kiritimatiellia bacterium]
MTKCVGKDGLRGRSGGMSVHMPDKLIINIILLVCWWLTLCSPLSADTIKIGQFAGATSVKACLNSPEFEVTNIVWDKNSTNWSYQQWMDLLGNYQVVVFPGGSGGVMYNKLGREGQRAVKDYVNKGGGYLGVCAGAWLATKRYLGIANIEGVEPWYVGMGGLEVIMEQESRNVFSSAQYQAPSIRTIEMHNGPMWSFTPPDKSRPAYRILASYTEARGTNKNGGNVFKGKPAIVIDVYGQGKIILFSPHPELVSRNGNYNMIPEAVRWLINQYIGPDAGTGKTNLCDKSEKAAENTSEPYVISREGSLPIIISAPHGGSLAFPGVVARTGGNEVKQFAIARDVSTDVLALELSAALLRDTGKAPFLVVAKISRKYVDLNRAEKDAFESPSLREVYEAYHSALEKYCRQVARKWGGGLLLDIHGQGVRSDSIFRGTRNGATTALLLKKFGAKVLTGTQGFQGLLEAKGFKVIPSSDSEDKESRFNGGYIVGKYGENGNYGIDAIQLEFGGTYTSKKAILETANILAEALSNYMALYISPSGQ